MMPQKFRDSTDPDPELQHCFKVQFATNLDYRDSVDHIVESIADGGAATKLVCTVVAIIDFRDSPGHGVESLGDDGAAHKACMYSCCSCRF
jgi:hypothetical protein